MRIAIGQFAPLEDKAANLETIAAFCRQAAEGGATHLFLPEAAMFPFDPSALAAAEPLDGPFVRALRDTSRQYGVAMLCGLFERSGETDRVFNTIVAIVDGDLAGTYRKIHLVDALGWQESAWVIPGEPDADNLLTIPAGNLTIGVATCYDLRFPEIFRALADRGVDLLVVPAAWAPGPLKEEHWLTLLRARAIENTAYAIGAGQCAPRGAGRSVVVDPMGVVIADAGEAQALLFADLSRERLDATRSALPVLGHRRFRVRPAER